MGHNNCFGMMKRVMSSMIDQEVRVGAVYKHYKGNLYQVIAVARDTENPELRRVVYQGLYNDPVFGKNPMWDRPYTMFAEHVVINGIKQKRFTLQD